jgi:NAD(P)H-flavin reductase/ferredoxin
MAKLHRIQCDYGTFFARSGQRLLDAALAAGVEVPHDCRAGHCRSCLTRVKNGITLGGEAHEPGTILACQAMVFSDLELEYEQVPPVQRTRGVVKDLQMVGVDIVEVTITPWGPITVLPGQYCRFRFNGFPARAFSPTAPMAGMGRHEDSALRLHIKRVREGRVTPHLGTRIRVGHKVTIDGPFGSAFLRPGLENRLILVGSGTGFAPIWAVAAAALADNRQRRIELVAASRSAETFYMLPALEAAAQHAGVNIIPVVERMSEPKRPLRTGPVTDHVPKLHAEDIVYAAGAPKIVDEVGELARTAGARFYSDPFVFATIGSGGWLESARGWLRAA